MKNLSLNPEEKIHHIDGDVSNNSLINLMYFPNHSEHRKFEGRIDMSNRFCLICGSKKTYIVKEMVRPKWFHYKGGVICRKC